jgi:large subunit ribosomal protein L15
MPLHRRIPKVGFKNPFAKEFETVNVERLEGLAAGSVVTDQSLAEAGIVSRIGANGVKILGHGDLGVALHVRVSKLSRSAAQKIMAAGGTIEGPVPGS